MRGQDNFSTLQESLNSPQSEGSKDLIIYNWMEQDRNNCSYTTLKQDILSVVVDEDYKTEIVKSWMKKAGNNLNVNQLKEILPLAAESGKAEIVQTWMTKAWNNLDVNQLKEILPFVDKDDHTEIVKSWMKKDGNNPDVNQLKEILQSVNKNNYKIIEDWLKKDGNNFTNTELTNEILPLVSKDNATTILYSWLKKDGNNFTNTELTNEILPLVGKDNAATILQSWVEKDKNHCTYTELKNEILPLIGDGKDRIMTSWLAKDGTNCTYTELKNEIIPLFKTNIQIITAFQTWLAKDGNNFDYQTIKEVLKTCDDKYKASMFEQWLKKDGNNCKYNELTNEILPLVNKDNKSDIVQNWLEKKGNNLDINQLKEILPLVSKDYQAEIVQDWMGKAENHCDISTLKEKILPLLSQDKDKSTTVAIWVKKERILDFDKLNNEILPLVNKESSKSVIVQRWMEKAENKCDIPTLKEKILPLFKNNDYKDKIVETWLRNERNLDFNTLNQEILPLVNDKDHTIRVWVGNKGTKFDYTALKDEILPLVTDNNTRNSIIEEWVRKDWNHFDYSELKDKILPLVTSNYIKNNILTLWLKKEDNPEKRCDKLLEVIKSNFGLHNYEVITKFCANEVLPKDKIPTLCKNLYPNLELLQAELFNEFIQAKQLTKEDIGIIKSFTSTLTENDPALSVLKAAKEKCGLSETDILDIAGDRLHSKYGSITELLKGNTLQNSLTDEGLGKVKALFGDARSASITLAGLFSYYDITDNIGGFTALVKPEVLAGIKQNFIPSDKSAYIQEAEYKKLQVLAGVDLPPMTDLCTYLKSKVPPTPQLNAAAIDEYKIDFNKCESVPPEKQPGVQDKFKALLKADNPSADDVADLFSPFYQKAMKLGHTIDESEKKKLCEFFKGNKNEVALLFSREGGLDKFAGCIGALGDGCVANIATQVKDSLYTTLITDPSDQKLYLCFSGKIAAPILNSGGDHLGGSATGTDVFNNHTINRSCISPIGFFKELEKEFNIDKNGTYSQNALKVMLGEGRFNSVYDILDPDFDNQNLPKDLAELATHLTIKATIPTLLDNKYLQPLKDKCEGLLVGVDKVILRDATFYNVAEAINIAAQKNTTTQVVGAHIISSALMNTCDSNVATLSAALNIKDPMAKPDSQAMQTNSRIKSLGKEIATKNATASTINKIVNDSISAPSQSRDFLG
jgi:uncharacterized membrane protein YheB (UPF0754 family)